MYHDTIITIMFWFPELGGWEPPQVVGNLKVPHLFGFTRLRGYEVTRLRVCYCRFNYTHIIAVQANSRIHITRETCTFY